MTRYLAIALVAALAGLASDSRPAKAAFPERTIRIIVPFAPGGPIDAFGRPLAAAMQEILGATVVVENRSGAGGITGAESVASSPADGYTLLLSTSSHLGNKVFNPAQLRYDPLRSFTPVVGLIDPTGVILLVKKDIPADSIVSLAAYAKSKPNGLTYGHAGIGGIAYVAGEKLKKQNGMPISGIPYRGVSPAMTDLLSGQIDIYFTAYAGVRGYVDDGKVKVIASTGTERVHSLPNLPTMQENGFADFVLITYIGMWAPRDTPKATVDRLYESIREALARPNIRELFATFGIGTQATPPEEFASFLERDLVVQQGWARDLGIDTK